MNVKFTFYICYILESNSIGQTKAHVSVKWICGYVLYTLNKPVVLAIQDTISFFVYGFTEIDTPSYNP